MKKVAIMTWWHYANYGTALQVTALSSVIKKLGFEAEIINYIPHGKVVSNESFSSVVRYALDKTKQLFNLTYVDEKRNKKFADFLNEYVNLTGKCETKSDLFELNKKFDAFICGSDQIWGPTVFNSNYFLDFVPQNKKIAYAPSLGVIDIADDYVKHRISELIEDFKYLSVREQQGKDLIKNLCNKDAKVVADPTMLLDKNEWNDLLGLKEKHEKEKYILCYFLGDNKKHWNYVDKLSKTLGLTIKVIPMHKNDVSKGNNEELCDPKEFVELIANAEYVCTDSFHGVVFSINYNKQFCVFERFNKKDIKSQNSRIYNILSIFKLENRLVDLLKPCDLYLEKIDYKQVNNIIMLFRKDSLEFLNTSLKNVINSPKSKVLNIVTNTCCGCGACAAVCPQNAITIEKNEFGFYSSKINSDRCIGCNLCRQVCAFYGKKGKDINADDKLYALKSINVRALQESSSGGFAHELSKYYLNKGYDIFGCAYNNTLHEAEHIKINSDNKEELFKLSGSKYLQSNTFKIFNEIIKSEKGIFIGTPCQAAAVDKFLKLNNKREKFIIVDLICHGVPSYNMYHKYLSFIKYKFLIQTIGSVIFRCKKKGWRERYIYISNSENNKYYCQEQHKDLFYKFFLLGHCYMQSCFECNYRKNAAADIRIGDYWGPKYRKDRTGVSMVIACSENGKEVVDNLIKADVIKGTEAPIDDYFKYQDCNNPVMPVFYNELQNELTNPNMELVNIASKYCNKYFVWKNRLWEVKDLVKRVLGMNG